MGRASVFPPIERHGVIGDRRTGALVAADGTIDWFCAPEFDGTPIFGSLLDPEGGGFCRLGPSISSFGSQSYLPGTASLVTSWPEAGEEKHIEVTDVMAWPDDERPEADRSRRVIIRRLRNEKSAPASFQLRARRGFAPVAVREEAMIYGASYTFDDGTLGLWTSFPIEVTADGVSANISCDPGYERWVVLGWNVSPRDWSLHRAVRSFDDAQRYWVDWSAGLKVEHFGGQAEKLRRSAITVQILSHAHHDCAVAALTTSLPERIGGDRNYDYRYAWVRDSSLALAFLARLGKTGEVRCYLDWLCRLTSTIKAPLQPCYRLDSDPRLDLVEITGRRGYKDSRPVVKGNRAARQLQLGCMGFFADCAKIYVEHGGEWRDEFWELLRRVARFTCAHWKQEDSGIWELEEQREYVASRVMSWVVLKQAVFIAEHTGRAGETGGWLEAAAEIHAEVMEKGWCDERGAFRERYGSDALDAAALLIPLMGFLPIDHPRVKSTLKAIEERLVVDGVIHRFDPAATFGPGCLPMAEFEGAFLPCVFWHAHALAKADRCDDAEAILRKCEDVAGGTGIFAEELDAKRESFLGNTPLLFSHVEYARAVIELHEARNREKGKAAEKE